LRALKRTSEGLGKTQRLQFSQHVLAELFLSFSNVQVGVQSEVITAVLPLIPEVVDPRLEIRDRQVVGDGVQHLLETELYSLRDVPFDIVIYPDFELTVIQIFHVLLQMHLGDRVEDRT
jgi:hypothetical protein